jgi:hypothetical protein
VTASNGSQSARVRKLYALANDLELSRDERIELTQIILRRNIVSWENLPDDLADRMLDAFEGYEKISWLLTMRCDAT